MWADRVRPSNLSTRLAAALIGLAALASCGRGAPRDAGQAGGAPPAVAPQPVPVAKPRVVFLGDSLTAGYGLAPDQAYPSLIAERLRGAGFEMDVVNAGVSGDTSAGGLRRAGWALEGDVRVLVVALGGNDALRGLGTGDLHRNLAAIIGRARAQGVAVILAGMEAPPNLGEAYTRAFRNVYRDLAETYRVPLVPFLLDGVAGRPELNQADGIHPNQEGMRRVADLVWPFVERAVRGVGRHE